jgi:VWFA-related protein
MKRQISGRKPPNVKILPQRLQWKRLLLLAFPLAAIATLHAQQPAAAPNQVQAGSGPSTFTLRTGTNLVIVDAIVSGPDGHPVRGLKASDFTLTEDRVPQKIRDFQEHTEAPAARATAAAPKLAPGLFTNYAPAVSDGPANIVLLDMLNTPLRDQAYARMQIQDFLNHAPTGTQIAIFGLSDKLTILQGFTTDPAILKAALSKKSAMKASSLLDDATGGGGSDGAGASAVSDSLAGLGSTPDVLEAVANAQQFEAEGQTFRFQLRAQMTLDAMNELARYLANIPGRKNLIWFSGSFPISILPDPTLNNGFAMMASSEEEFRETTSLLTRARVALYPVDARGLTNSNTFSATSNSAAKYARNPAAVGADEAKFEQQMEADNSTMLQAAKDTGGHAFINTNALSDAVGKAIDDGSNFYTLTFSPANTKWDGRYRKIELAVPNKGYQLSYRRGYYADDPNSPGQHEKPQAAAVAVAAKNALSRGMVRGAPVPTQIQFTVRVRAVTGEPETTVASGNELASAEPEAHAPFTRYAVDFAIDPHDFSFAQADGNFHDDIEFVTFVYDQSGNLVNRSGATLHADFKPAVYADFIKRPFSYNQDVSVPRKGNFFLRIGIHDGNSDRMGAIEIPVDTVKGLAPLSSTGGEVKK